MILKLLEILNLEEETISCKSEAYRKATLLKADMDKQLREKLTPSEIELYDKYLNSTYECWNLDEQEFFKKGFIMGAKIMLEVLSKETE